MNWLLVSWYLTLAVVPAHDEMTIAPDRGQVLSIERERSYITDLGLSFSFFDHMKMFGSVETEMLKNGNAFAFNPYASAYTAGASIFAKGLEVGVLHRCEHPTASAPFLTERLHVSTHTMLFVKVSGETRF